MRGERMKYDGLYMNLKIKILDINVSETSVSENMSFDFEYFEKIPGVRDFRKVQRELNLETQINFLIELCNNNYSDPTLLGWFNTGDRNYAFLLALNRIKESRPNLQVSDAYHCMMVPGRFDTMEEYIKYALS